MYAWVRFGYSGFLPLPPKKMHVRLIDDFKATSLVAHNAKPFSLRLLSRSWIILYFLKVSWKEEQAGDNIPLLFN